jgi:hypothetical protein
MKEDAAAAAEGAKNMLRVDMAATGNLTTTFFYDVDQLFRDSAPWEVIAEEDRTYRMKSIAFGLLVKAAAGSTFISIKCMPATRISFGSSWGTGQLLLLTRSGRTHGV